MSSNLMNMKVATKVHNVFTFQFMQRGRDTELTAMLKQQQAQEISDQQWHLSIIKEDDHFKYHPLIRLCCYKKLRSGNISRDRM